MAAAGWALLAGVVSIVLIQACLLLRLAWVFRKHVVPAVADDRLPAAAIVVALRGADPGLADNLRALLHQDYPRFEVRVVVDSREDPACTVVSELQAEDGGGRLRLELLEAPCKTCSLKNSALAQAVRRLDPSFEVVAFFDADVHAYRQWLRDLVAPLRDPAIGLTTGYRWYQSPDGGWGSLVRYLWNAGALVQIWLNRMVWAGSMAIRASLIAELDLPNVWERSLSTDGPLYPLLAKQGQRVAFVPRAIMLTREEISLCDLARWLQRQMMVARLYHPRFGVVSFHAIGVTLAQVAALGFCAWALFTSDRTLAVCAAGSLGVYWSASLLFVVVLEWAVRGSLRHQGLTTGWLQPRLCLRMMAALLVTHVMLPFVLLAARGERSVHWRGIRYRVKGPWQIQMVRYRPYRASRTASRTGMESVL